MAIINLRKHYYPLYTKDTFVEVPDEVATVLEECRLYENRQEGRKSYYHVYSMDCSPGIENHAMFLVQSPEDLIIREIDEAAEELLLEHLAEAISQLSPTQARRLHARYALKKKFREIATDEGINLKNNLSGVSEGARIFGRYGNVFLPEAEVAELQADFPTVWQEYIERLSEYMASTGKTYKSHAATIRRWAKEDRRKGVSDYSCKEGESL